MRDAEAPRPGEKDTATGRVKGENRAPDLSGWRFRAETWPALVPKIGPRGDVVGIIGLTAGISRKVDRVG